MSLPLSGTPTREVYEPIGTVESYIFSLAVMSILLFVVGVSRRVRSYTAGPADGFERTVEAARITMSSQKQFDRNLRRGDTRVHRVGLSRLAHRHDHSLSRTGS